MEFFLIKDKHLDIHLERSEFGGNGRVRRVFRGLKIQLETVVKSPGGPTGYSECLADTLVENTGVVKGILDSESICPFLNVSITIPTLSSDEKKGSFRIFSNEPGPTTGANIFQRFTDVYGAEEVKANFQLTGFIYRNGGSDKMDFVVRDLDMVRDKNGTICYGCAYNHLDFPDDMVQGPWFAGKKFSGYISVSVTLGHKAVNSLYLQKFQKSEMTQSHKRALDEAICSDLEIVAGNGERIKCHKSYLAMNSDVFRAMFESQMKEATSNSIDMPDMSESGVRAFLNFIYNWDLRETSKSCDIAFELFSAGHKYNICEMEKAMRELICSKPAEWFNVDMTVKLLILSKISNNDKEELDDLFKKALHILKWFNKSSPNNLMDSVEYQQLFQKNPKLAMEVSTCFLSDPNEDRK